MAVSVDRKIKKKAVRQRKEQLREALERVREEPAHSDHGDAGGSEPIKVTYVYDMEELSQVYDKMLRGAQGPSDAADDHTNAAEEEDLEEDTVVLPSVMGTASSGAAQRGTGKSTHRKQHKMSWEALKMAIVRRYGPEAGPMVEMHDGDADDPLFSTWLKLTRGAVGVPRHWLQSSSFLSKQVDREAAMDVVPLEIQALPVDKIRASKDKKATMTPEEVANCFLTGNPLSRKTFGMRPTPHGELFHSRKWAPKGRHVPGVLSQRLKDVIGMSAPNMPPPWLLNLQAMGRLPPAYPNMRIPGLNAPIPPGAKWGDGEGQWGQPLRRKENGAFLFPGLMDERDEMADNAEQALFWGDVPEKDAPHSLDSVAARAGAGEPKPAVKPAAKPPAAQPSVVNPEQFKPREFVRQTEYTTPQYDDQEYVAVPDRGVGKMVTVGQRFVPKRDAPDAPSVQ